MKKIIFLALLQFANCYAQTTTPMPFESEQTLRIDMCGDAERSIATAYSLTEIDDVLTICGMVDTHDDECTMLVEECGY